MSADQQRRTAGRPRHGIALRLGDDAARCFARLEALGVPHEVRVVSAHRTPDVLFSYAETAAIPWPARDHRRRRRGRPPAGHAGLQDRRARAGRTGAEQGVERHGFAVVDRADAGRHPGSHLRYRQCRRGQRRRCSRRRCWPANIRQIAEALAAFRAKQTQDVIDRDDPTCTIRARMSEPRDLTTVGILGGGQLARMMALSGAPLGLRFLRAGHCGRRLRRPVRADGGGRLQRPVRADGIRGPGGRGDLRFRERAGGIGAVADRERVPVFPNPRALAIGAGSAGREDPVPRAGHPRAAVCSHRRTRAAVAGGGRRKSAPPAFSRPAGWATTARASSASSRRATSMPRGTHSARRPARVGLILEGFVAVPARAVAWSRCVVATVNSVPGR